MRLNIYLASDWEQVIVKKVSAEQGKTARTAWDKLMPFVNIVLFSLISVGSLAWKNLDKGNCLIVAAFYLVVYSMVVKT